VIGDIGAPELLIILAIVVLVFGVGKVGSLGRELGSSVREFRRAVKDEDDDPPVAQAIQQVAAQVADPALQAPSADSEPRSHAGPHIF
jgi:sec-independent protein translocase protein TatA